MYAFVLVFLLFHRLYCVRTHMIAIVFNWLHQIPQWIAHSRIQVERPLNHRCIHRASTQPICVRITFNRVISIECITARQIVIPDESVKHNKMWRAFSQNNFTTTFLYSGIFTMAKSFDIPIESSTYFISITDISKEIKWIKWNNSAIKLQ